MKKLHTMLHSPFLPVDVLLEIFLFLSVADLFAFSTTCKYYRKIFMDSRKQIYRHFKKELGSKLSTSEDIYSLFENAKSSFSLFELINGVIYVVDYDSKIGNVEFMCGWLPNNHEACCLRDCGIWEGIFRVDLEIGGTFWTGIETIDGCCKMELKHNNATFKDLHLPVKKCPGRGALFIDTTRVMLIDNTVHPLFRIPQ